jgi:DNA-binding transcriptional LysR family regulator
MWRLQRQREVREVQVVARVSVPDPSVHHQLALKGVGIAMLGQAEVVPDLKERRLVRLLPEWEPEPIELYALHPSRLAASPKVRVLLEFLAETLRRCLQTQMAPSGFEEDHGVIAQRAQSDSAKEAQPASICIDVSAR